MEKNVPVLAPFMRLLQNEAFVGAVISLIVTTLLAQWPALGEFQEELVWLGIGITLMLSGVAAGSLYAQRALLTGAGKALDAAERLFKLKYKIGFPDDMENEVIAALADTANAKGYIVVQDENDKTVISFIEQPAK